MLTKSFLKRIAREILGEELAKTIWSRMEILGDILIIRIPYNVDVDILKPLAERVLKELPYLKSVWGGFPGVKGDYRLRQYVHLAGEKRSETIYKEYGCVFKIDFTKVYVSPTLSYEHYRVARLVEKDEVVTNMFAGAGFFSIIIAKYSKPKLVYSIDINPDAYRYMVENIKLNKVENIVIPLQGDAAEIIEKDIHDSSDRVLMPYPDIALDYLIYGVKALRDKGWIHVYLHVNAGRGEDPVKKAEDVLSNKLSELNIRDYFVKFGRIVRLIGPRKYQVVLDTFINR
ncbi:MAG: class I SAM-dependent methyltransferase family protein [Desulfurococcaceae archaeon]|uniref:Class I SAM-dependent methyltransferase family protein n=1 Tax=Staphylothermus marinus TaxID=2280 RepID=A0A7C4DAW2_STAMA